jgi:hypothetical protein
MPDRALDTEPPLMMVLGKDRWSNNKNVGLGDGISFWTIAAVRLIIQSLGAARVVNPPRLLVSLSVAVQTRQSGR